MSGHSTAARPVRVIYVPGCEQWVTLGEYVRAIQLAKAHPQDTFTHGLTCWYPCTGADIMRQFRQGVTDRINEAIPCTERGMAACRKEREL